MAVRLGRQQREEELREQEAGRMKVRNPICDLSGLGVSVILILQW